MNALYEAVAKLRRALNAIRLRTEALLDAKRERSVAAAAVSVRRNHLSPPADPAGAIVAHDDKTARDEKVERDRQYRVQSSLRWATWCAFGSATIYALFALWQGIEMRRAADAAARSADTVLKQLKSTQAAVPRLTFSSSDEGELIITVENAGQVILQGARVRADITRERLSGAPTTSPLPLDIGVPALPPSSFNPGKPYTTLFQRPFVLLGVSAQELKAIHDETSAETIAVRGELTYPDGFGETIERAICLKYFGHPALKISDNEIMNAVHEFYPCDTFDAAVRDWQELRLAHPPR